MLLNTLSTTDDNENVSPPPSPSDVFSSQLHPSHLNQPQVNRNCLVSSLVSNPGGACCSLFGGEQTLYDGVTIAGLVLPKDRRSVTGGPGPVPGAIYDQPNEMEATIRWPAPPLFSLEDEQRQQQQRGQSNKAATLMGRVKQQQQHQVRRNKINVHRGDY